MSSKIKNKYSFLLFWWIKFVHDVLYYRKTYVRRVAHTLPKDSPCVIACNHQNSLNDAMAIILTMHRRKIWFLARADIFSGKIQKKFLNSLGVLPVYRQRDGFSNLKNNFDIFDKAEKYLLNGCLICLYPEAKHQDRHYLGQFYLSYIRLAFNAAAAADFTKEVFILPCANHYSDYFAIQSDILINYGTPISLVPYYELYRTNPRLAQEQVNKLVHSKVDELMLNIQDTENYDAIYNLLNNVGNDYAYAQHVNAKKLPDKLRIDQYIVKQLENLKVNDIACFNAICQTSEQYSILQKRYQLTDNCIAKPYSLFKIVYMFIGFVATFCIFVLGFIHHIIPYLIPKIVSRNIKDPLLKPSFDLAIITLVTIPIFYIIYGVILSILFHCFWITLVYLIALPFCGIFTCWWLRYAINWFNMLKTKFFKHFRRSIWETLQGTRLHLRDMLFKVLQ